MTKSEMFKKAHETARATKAIVGDYRIAFSLALKELYAGMKKMTKSIETKLLDLGCNLWEKGDHKRIYLTNDYEFAKALGLHQAADGKWYDAEDNRIFTSKDKTRAFASVYYDCNTREFNANPNHCGPSLVAQTAEWVRAHV